MTEPALSVILPVYNAGPYLDQALRSVLRQADADLEILAVDDGSTDDSAARLAAWQAIEPRIRVQRIENRGPAGARNAALAMARAPLLAFIDADDLWPADKLALQCARLAAEPRLEAVSGFTSWFDRAAENGLEPATDARVVTLFHVHLGALVLRRATLERLGGFDEALRFSEDQDLYMRLREHGLPFTILQRPTLYYRRHEASMTGGVRSLKELQLFDVLRRSLARRRIGGAAQDLGAFADHLDRPA